VVTSEGAIHYKLNVPTLIGEPYSSWQRSFG